MEGVLQGLGAAVFLAVAAAMILYEQSRLRAKRPLLSNSNHLLELYWMVYCALLAVGATLAMMAIARMSAGA